MEDIFLLLFVGLVMGLVAASVVRLWHYETTPRRIGIGFILALTSAWAIVAHYVVWVNQSVHGDGRFQLAAVVVAELPCVVTAFQLAFWFWRRLGR